MKGPLTLLCSALLLWLGCALQAVLASIGQGNRVLVVHDASVDKNDYSTYFKALKAQGLQLSFRSANQASPALYSHDVAQFDHLLLFAPSTKSFDTDLSPQRLVQFLQENGNILFALSSDVSELYRDLAREFEIELEENGMSLVDHFASLQRAGDDRHTSIAVSPTYLQTDLSGVFAGLNTRSPFLFKGIAHRLGASPLAFPILKAPSTSYSFELPEDLSAIERMDNPDREVIVGSDSDVALISAFQLLDTNRRDPGDLPKRQGSAGRALFCGSLEAFSNAFTRPSGGLRTRQGESFTETSNLPVLTALTSWLTQQRGVLRVETTAHSRNKLHAHDVRESYEEFDVYDEQEGQKRLQRIYRIKDHVTFSIDLVQRTPSGWGPAPRDLDLQVSLVMLDPYITTNLTAAQPQSHGDDGLANDVRKAAVRAGKSADGENALVTSPRTTRYTTTFQLPDRHGVYTFVVDWKRPGWSYVFTRDTSPVRPFNHDEHPRGLHSAWPYVVGASSTVVAFLAFVILWACSQDDERTEEEKQRKND